MPGAKNLAIFDGDDTLWSVQALYDEAKAEFARIAVPPERTSETIALLDEIDAEAVGSQGFARSRFSASMIETYRRLRESVNGRTAELTEELIKQIGERVFARSPELFDGAIDCLTRVKTAYKVVLLTKGDRAVQAARLEQTGLRPYFDAVYITPTKTEAEYITVLRDMNAQSRVGSWAVGNSVRSDINPAIRVGLRCILLARHTWKFEEAELETGDVLVAHSLSEVADMLLQDERNRNSDER